MRKHLLIIAFTLAACFSVNAESVSASFAASKAATFLHLKSDSQLLLMKSPYETFYLFSIDGGGFVIVSADNRVLPILGYSLQSNLDVDNLPANLAAWLDGYDKQIRAVMEDASLPVHPGWQQASPKSSLEGYDSIAGPLMTTTWGQSPFYNDLCPQINGEGVEAGCIATAMAQIMKYWNWPDVGVGQHSYNSAYAGTQSADFSTTHYDWANMPNSLTSSSTPAQVNAVATLMYHCGVAVDMDYNTLLNSGSGAFAIMSNHGLNYPCAENALRNNFKYSPSLVSLQRRNFSNDEWADMMKNEIDHRRPILYCGVSVALGYGHAFVCDGYDTNGYFHFNWGWSGDDDGFFSLSDISPTFYSFNANQTAVIGIEPDTLYGSNATCTVSAFSLDTTFGTVSGGGTFTYRDTVTLRATPAAGRRFLHWSNGSSNNPYPFLAHNDSLTAFFTGDYAENNDTISYTGTNTDNVGLFAFSSSYRIGIKLTPSLLSGHEYLTAIDFYHYTGQFVLYIHRGGDNAPGPIVYTQPFEIGPGSTRWHRAQLETPMPIDTNNDLWITVRTLSDRTLLGAKDINVPNGNWVSQDNGSTWLNLNEATDLNSRDDSTICWFIRCITSHDSADTPVTPTAFITAPEKGNIGDTLQMELIHSSASTAEWQFGDASYSQVANDTAYVVWNTVGLHTVIANVTNPHGSASVDISLPINDCYTPVNTFPYQLTFNEQDEYMRLCWEIYNYGEGQSYIIESGDFSAIISDRDDDRYVSPLFDLSGDLNYWLQLQHITPEGFDITVEVSQGGVDSSDFVPIYTLPALGQSVTTPPINLSEHYHGDPIRVAIRMRNPYDYPSVFHLESLRIWGNSAGIDAADNAILTVSPNPANQKVMVELPELGGTLTLFDATGRQLVQRTAVETKTTLDVHTLPQGVYLLQYTSPRGTITKRLIVQ